MFLLQLHSPVRIMGEALWWSLWYCADKNRSSMMAAGSTMQGRVEICRGQEWGKACDDFQHLRPIVFADYSAFTATTGMM